MVLLWTAPSLWAQNSLDSIPRRPSLSTDSMADSFRTDRVGKFRITRNQKALEDYRKAVRGRHERAQRIGRQKGWLIYHADSQRVMELMEVTSDSQPMYYQTLNYRAAQATYTDQVWKNPDYTQDSITGQEQLVSMWDGGGVLTSHPDFGGRVEQKDNVRYAISHATHVAGTIAASGDGDSIDAKGMAYSSKIAAYDWNDDQIEAAELVGKKDYLISNHSYGTTCGFSKRSDGTWRFYSDEEEDPKFGWYSETASLWDKLSYLSPNYLHVRSAGNDRGEGPPPGTLYFYYSDVDGWTPTLREREHDGPYDCIIPEATAKNILSVGASNDNKDISFFSSTGPTDDGRIKPDIVAPGVNLLSTGLGSQGFYYRSSGTSMSAPVTTGSLTLLQQLYKEKYRKPMTSSALKALVIHTADPVNTIPIPSYKTGWGSLNTKAAADLIALKESMALFYDETLDELTSTLTYNLRVGGDEDVKITLCWTDPEGPYDDPPELNKRTPRLVNDLDIRLTKGSDEYLPYILDPEKPEQEAKTGNNSVDNIERIFLENPTAGDYQLTVSRKGVLHNKTQRFSLVITGASSFTLPPSYLAEWEEKPTIPDKENTFSISSKIAIKGRTIPQGDVVTFLSTDTIIDHNDIILNKTTQGTVWEKGMSYSHSSSEEVSVANVAPGLYALLQGIKRGDGQYVKVRSKDKVYPTINIGVIVSFAANNANELFDFGVKQINTEDRSPKIMMSNRGNVALNVTLTALNDNSPFFPKRIETEIPPGKNKEYGLYFFPEIEAVYQDSFLITYETVLPIDAAGNKKRGEQKLMVKGYGFNKIAYNQQGIARTVRMDLINENDKPSLRVQVYNPYTGKMILSLVNLSGRLVWGKEFVKTSEDFDWTIDLQQGTLPAGIYVLVLDFAEERVLKKVPIY